MPDFVAIGNTGDALNTDEYMTSGFGIKFLNDNEGRLDKSSYRLSIHEHNHPLGSPPSGHFKDGSIRDYYGDSGFARYISKKRISASNIKFYVNPKGKNFKYQYDGKTDFKIIKK